MRPPASHYLAWIAGMLLSAAPVMAHHAFSAEFDAKKPVTIRGFVTKVEWTNPHVWVYLDVKDEAGKVTTWAFESISPNALARQGWTG